MNPITQDKPVEELSEALRLWLHHNNRLGLITSIDGTQLVTLVLDISQAQTHCWISPLQADSYHSLTPNIPQAHWFERTIFDTFAVLPTGHPRLKPVILNEAYTAQFAPLQSNRHIAESRLGLRDFNYMHVAGEGVYEIPVGPVHAGIIEPGHFMLSAMGETVLNLEIRLGYLHRGVEKRMTEVPWSKARFVAESAASDTAAANALASANAIESLLGIDISDKSLVLRSLALEVERIAMHIGDVGGMAVDLGYGAVSGALSRLRGLALRLADLLSGSRYLRGFICPGGVTRDPDKYLAEFRNTAKQLRRDLMPVINNFLSNPSVYERLHGTGVLSASLAKEFGMVGVIARASSISYDVRNVFRQKEFPGLTPPISIETDGDALARTKVRISEIDTSFDLIAQLLDTITAGHISTEMPMTLKPNSVGLGIVEAFRGELIHLAFTDKEGQIMRYAIKDPSFNNWTGLAISVRNNVVADFPVCNKSFGLSYSGHDL